MGGAGVQFFFVLSGFLAGYSFSDETEIRTYYKKRMIRILPAYYVAVIGAMIFHYLVLKDVTTDSFGLGWLRYFFGLNTVLPSTNYDLWNNTYGLWTMSCFIWFYIMVPAIFRWVKSLNSALYFFIATFIVSIGWKIGINSIFSRISDIESLDILTGASPFGVLYEFSIGILVYFLLKEKKNFEGIILLSLVSICGIILGKNTFVWCALCGLMIIAFENIKINLSYKVQKYVYVLGRESFHVYLAHLLSFNIAWIISGNIIRESNFLKYIVWMVISVISILCFCCSMNFCEKKVASVLGKC